MDLSAADLLDRLVGFPSVVGTPNGALMAFVADYLRAYDVPFTLLKGPEGDRYNLFATIGDASVPGYILSGHVDVVPAQEPEWQADPFVMRRVDERLIGRGVLKPVDPEAAARLMNGAALNAALWVAASDDPDAVLPKAVDAFRCLVAGFLA